MKVVRNVRFGPALAVGLGVLAVPAGIAVALFDSPVAVSAPGAAPSALNVVGEPYAKAMAILKSQGVRGTFGGSVGSDLPQAACIVDQQKVIPSGKMILMLDCTQKAADDATDSAPAVQAPPPGSGGRGGSPNLPSMVNGIPQVTLTPDAPVPAAG